MTPRLRLGAIDGPQERTADATARVPLGTHNRAAAPLDQSFASAGAAPEIVGRALSGRGEPLDGATRNAMQPRFGRDFSRVRVHTGQLAARSAQAVDAEAYTVGSSIVFDAGRYAPATLTGRALIAHELAHVVQHEIAPRSAESPVVMRKSRSGPFSTIGGFFKSLFHVGKYADPDLLAYLGSLHDTGLIEGDPDSDDKARETVERWASGGAQFKLNSRHKRLLIEEMVDGYVSGDDRARILQLLESNLGRGDANEIYVTPGLDTKALSSALDEDDSRARFNAVVSRHIEGGLPALLAGKKVLRTAAPAATTAAVTPAPAVAPPTSAAPLTEGEKKARDIAAQLKGQAKTEKRDRQEFQTGGITADAGARTDFAQNVFINADDSRHLTFFGDKLGVDIAYTTPRDPFRWDMLKTIIAEGAVDIRAINADARFKVVERMPGLPDTPNDITLASVGGNGLTAIRPSLAAAAGERKAILSPSNRDQVVYRRGLTSGAHELFGHVWLAMHGVPSGHGASLAGTQTIRDPFGGKFTGAVNTFIDEFVQDRGNPRNLQSRTEDMSDNSLNAAVRNFVQVAARADSYTVTASFTSRSPGFLAAWQALRRMYVVLLRNSTEEKGRLDTIIQQIRKARDGLSPDQKLAFDLFMWDERSVLGLQNPEAHLVAGLPIGDPRSK
jgi:Domain of unknown function (DUF4157)